MSSFFENRQTQPTNNDNAALQVYEWAKTISGKIAQPNFISYLLKQRESARTMLVHLELNPDNIDSIVKGASEELKDLVFLLTFVPEKAMAEKLECITNTKGLLEYLKEKLTNTCGFAVFDDAIELLQDLEKEALKDLQKPTVDNSTRPISVTNITVNTPVRGSPVLEEFTGGYIKQLTGQEIEQLKDAILRVFPSEDDLNHTLALMEIKWDNISSGSNYMNRVYYFIARYTEPRDITHKVLELFIQEKPRNETLKTLYNNFYRPSGNTYISGGNVSNNVFIGTQTNY